MTVKIPPRHGSRHGSAKLGEDFVIEIRRAAHRLGYYPIARIARANGVTYRTLKDALNGETYRHCDRAAAPFKGPTGTGPKGSVVRLDHESTKGWQARFRGKSKFYADRRTGGSMKAKAAATRWLQLTRSQELGKGA